MIENGDILPVAFLKKSPFTGSYKGMRFRLSHVKENDEVFLETVIWEEPYGFEATPSEKKESGKFPFSEEGIIKSVNWLNDKWEEQNGKWGNAKNNW